MDSYPFRFLITWTVFSGIGVPHGVLREIWVYLELKRGVNVIIGRAERWKRPSRSDTVKLLRPALLERPYQSNAEKSLTFSSLGDTKTGPERRLAATPPGRSRSLERPPGATPSSRSDLPYQSDLARATQRSRSRFHRSETRKRARSDVSQRPLQVAPEAWSDLSERLLEVAARLLFVRIHVYSRAFWSFHYGVTFPERHRQVALTCLIRATLPERCGEVARVFIARRHENGPVTTSRSDPSRSLPKPGATLPERRGEVARVFIARRHENGPRATSRSDPSRSLPKPGATSRSDYWRSLRAYCIGVPNGVPGDIWVHLELKGERRREVARVSIARHPSQSDLPERRSEVARVSMARRHPTKPGATSQSDPLRSLPKAGATCQSDMPRSLRVYLPVELITMEIEHCMHELVPFLDILCAMSRLLVLRVNHLKRSCIGVPHGAQKRCKCDHWTSRALGATLSERHCQVALTCLIRATLPERRGEVARVFIARRHENGPGATSRSDLSRSLPKPGATSRSDTVK
ncbi:hypothetical protein F2Q69_00004186 [Brassica cretica]|uniref:Uncharacterized protein n=1 Tax=Brassica cretica TaxID=69181 RepID=A0A8S9PA11_BRACR|nr:hypothetical protein F2Q69_00004186 [Brassica cretica]